MKTERNKIRFFPNRKLKNLRGEFIRVAHDNDSPIAVLGEIAVTSLLQDLEGDSPDPILKLRRWRMAQKIDEVVESGRDNEDYIMWISEEDLEMVENRILRSWPTMICGPAVDALTAGSEIHPEE